MKLDSIQPTQLYISSAKLECVMTSVKESKSLFGKPIPIKKLGNQIIFIDGHTRALAAFLIGLSEVSAYWEYEELDWNEYEVCVRWCKEEGIRTISDLKERVVSPKDYQIFWLDRCEKMQQDLKAKKNHAFLQK
jgi:hypothetical protein